MSGQITETSAAMVTEQFVAAVLKGDIEAVRALLHPDLEVVEPQSLPFGGTHRGVDRFFADVLLHLTEAFELTVEDLKVFDGGASSAANMKVVYTSRRNGESIRMPYVEVYTAQEGLLVKIDVYPQDSTALAAWMEANR